MILTNYSVVIINQEIRAQIVAYIEKKQDNIEGQALYEQVFVEQFSLKYIGTLTERIRIQTHMVN